MKIRADLADYWLTPSLLKGIGASTQNRCMMVMVRYGLSRLESRALELPFTDDHLLRGAAFVVSQAG